MASPQEKRVALASLIGGSIEYYEFFVYGLSASLVFGKLFFPSFDPVAGTLLSLSTFAIAFLARPVGGWIFGHFGDRIGRRRVLILTLVGMGVATALVGVLPTYGAVGVAAPVSLVVLRVLQGISVGGETTGGFLMTFEHTKEGGRPGLFTGTVSTGNVCGLLLANGAFFLVTLLPDDQYRTWGWRLPFLFSTVLVGVGLYVRNRLAESPEFEAVRARGRVSRNPAFEVLRRRPGTFVGLILVTVPQSVNFYVASVFSFAYAKTVGVAASTVSVVVMTICAVLIVAMPVVGWLADRTGRTKMIFGVGMAVMAVSPFVWFPLFDTGRTGLIFVGFALLMGGFAINYGTQGLFYPPLFPAHLRYSGIGLSVAIGGVLGGAFAPVVAIWLLGRFDSWVPIAGYMSATALIGTVVALALRPRDATSPTPVLDELAVGT